MKYVLIVLCIALSGCDAPKTYHFTADDIMVIYQNGYLRGEINALKNTDNWQLDSMRMRSKFK